MQSKHCVTALVGAICSFAAVAADAEDFRDGMMEEASRKVSEAGAAALDQLRGSLADAMLPELQLAPLPQLGIARSEQHQTARL